MLGQANEGDLMELKTIKGAQHTRVFADCSSMIARCIAGARDFMQVVAQPAPVPVMVEAHRRR